jgi:rod shape-determining protein MreC
MRRSSKTRLLLWVCAALVTAGLIVASHQLSNGVSKAARSVYSPLRTATLELIQPIGRFFASGSNYGSLKSQNEKLQASIGQLKMQRDESAFEKIQLRDLKALQHLSFTTEPTVIAETIDITNLDFTSTITIDKGSTAGIDDGMPVVTGEGLVGQVIDVTGSTAVVRLVNDGESKVGVLINPPASCSGQTPCTGLVAGQGPSTDDLIVNGVPPLTAVQKGEVLKTSGLSSADFPGGIPVARIASFQTPSGAASEAVTATPMVNLDHLLLYVAVLQWEPNP